MAIVIDGTTGIDTPAINAGNIVGEVCFFGMTTAPAGFLKANGAAVSRSTYAALFTAIGTTYGAGNGSTTFNLPDLRGEFPRGWDDGRGVDSGRAIGTAQLDAFQNFTGTLGGSQDALSGDGAFSNNGSVSGQRPNNGTASRQSVTLDPSLVARTATETRPRNVALLACIKF
jgi:microcystin-dependent protein